MSIGASGHLPNEAQKSYRGPVLKGGLQIGQSMNNNALVGSFPNSTKNQVTTVTNKFSARDQSPNKKGQQAGAGGSGSVASNGQIMRGHEAQRGFQQPTHAGRVKSLDVSNHN